MEKRRADYEECIARGPYVVRRSDLSPEEELVRIAVLITHWNGNPRLDTNCLVYRDTMNRNSSMVCPGAHGYELTDPTVGGY